MCIARELVQNSLVEAINLIVSGTENSAIKEPLICLSPIFINPRIDKIHQFTNIITTHPRRNGNSPVSTNIFSCTYPLQPLSMLSSPSSFLQTHILSQVMDSDIWPKLTSAK